MQESQEPNFSLYDTFDMLTMPIVITDNEAPLIVRYHNAAAYRYLQNTFAGMMGTDIPNTADTRASYVGTRLLDYLDSEVAFYLLGAIHASFCTGGPISFRVPGANMHAPVANMTVQHLSHENASEPYLAFFQVTNSLSAGLIDIEDMQHSIARARPTVISFADNYPHNPMIFFSPDFAHVMRYDPQELIKMSYSDLLNQEGATKNLLLDPEDIEIGFPSFCIQEMRTKDGKQLFMTVTRVKTPGRGKTLLVSRLENITSIFELLASQNEEGAIVALSALLEQRSDETIHHTHRVARLATALAEKIGIDDPKVLKDIHMGGILHDIGKIGIPDSILLKKGPLTPAEWEIMRKHPVYGSETLSRLGKEKFKTTAEIVESHHLRWDGKGYPYDTQGTDIPIGARIVAIGDCFDALTSERPYKPAFSVKESLRIMREDEGHFDPELLDEFESGIMDGSIES